MFGDNPTEIRMVLKNGVCRSSSEALFSAEPTFVEKITSPNEPSNQNCHPLELRFWPPRAGFCDFMVRMSLYSILFSGRTPPGTREIRTFPKRAVARKRSAFRQEWMVNLAWEAHFVAVSGSGAWPGGSQNRKSSKPSLSLLFQMKLTKSAWFLLIVFKIKMSRFDQGFSAIVTKINQMLSHLAEHLLCLSTSQAHYPIIHFHDDSFID